MNGVIVHRANYPLIAEVLAEKLRRRSIPLDVPDDVRPVRVAKRRSARP